MNRRSILGAMVAAPVAAPQMVGEMVSQSKLSGVSIAGGLTGPSQDYFAEEILGMKSALASIDEVPDEHFTGVPLNGGPYSSFKSVSPAVQNLWNSHRYAKQHRERRRQQLIDQIDAAMGKPLSGWRKVSKWL